jgi:hypothetical protein
MDDEEEKLDEYRRFGGFDETSSIVDVVGSEAKTTTW